MNRHHCWLGRTLYRPVRSQYHGEPCGEIGSSQIPCLSPVFLRLGLATDLMDGCAHPTSKYPMRESNPPIQLEKLTTSPEVEWGKGRACLIAPQLAADYLFPLFADRVG